MSKFTWYYTIMLLLIFLEHHIVASSAVIHLSPTMQKNALFQFKSSLAISSTTVSCFYYYINNPYYAYEIPSYPKTANWNMSSNYCTWEGVSCEQKTGNVIGLDLSCSQLEGAILPNSTLFQLSHLQFLNLSQNDFSLSNQFPQEFSVFAKGLSHLNLSFTQFPGRVPSGISRLHKLVSLDLSMGYNSGLELEDEVFKSLLQNMTELRVLNLQLVNISSVLPVNLSTSLRVLNLRDTGLHGVLPQEVFHLPDLEVLDLSGNTNDMGALYFSRNSNFTGKLNVTLPKVKWGSSATLQHLYLPQVNINEGIPDSIGFLESLVSLGLPQCNLSGPIPTSIENLVQLTGLDLSHNNLNGPIPTSIGNLDQLTYLVLDHNNLNGPIPTSICNLDQLADLDLDHNNLNGTVPTIIGNLGQLINLNLHKNNLSGPIPIVLANFTNLEYLDISFNKFTGQLPSWVPRKSQLGYVDCGKNLLSGPIPQSFSQLFNLTHRYLYLDLSSNNFNGVLDIEMFSRLEYLYLSDNNLSVTSTSTLLPNLQVLSLSSCNMKEFPYFPRDAEIVHLDLSNNQLEGEIPQWIGLMSWGYFSYLNLSHNRLTGSLEHLPWNDILFLDLQSNMLNGSLPTLICNATNLEILNLSHNNLSGVLPICPTNVTDYYVIEVLDLRMNNIHGNIPATLSNFRCLESLNLHGNKLEGKIPSSFAEFDQLKLLDLGSNQINDTFPQFLETLPSLQVLVLKSNKFHGLVNKVSKMGHPFPSLRIIDLSHNEFSGPLPAIYFKNFKTMMNGEVNKIPRDYMKQSSTGNTYYSDSTVLVIKGVEVELVRILTIFTSIDLSKNNFKGEIDKSVGNLVSLRFLNLSHNHLTGHIPSSIGNLSMLESLDLSFNQLAGEIPQQLASINTLARLNLSCNQLTGHIPQGRHFDTFDNDSYVDNSGLCGYPLSKGCEGDLEKQKEIEDDDYFFSGFTWKSVVIGYGCGVVPAFIMGYLMLLAGKPKWFAGIIARELGLKIRRMEIKFR